MTQSWPYRFSLIDRRGFGRLFIGLLLSLYSLPKALIRLQGHYSKPINIARGTRQGCPLSPLIFAIAIKTLAIAILQNPNIKGVSCTEQTHKCRLFADDILLFVTLPLTSLPNICQVLNGFSKITGLKVNYTKSEALNVSLPLSSVSLFKQSFKLSGMISQSNTWASH